MLDDDCENVEAHVFWLLKVCDGLHGLHTYSWPPHTRPYPNAYVEPTPTPHGQGQVICG